MHSTTPTMDDTNQLFKLAASFVNNTSKHLFITGKAGTGKTTFLRYIKENTPKKVVVVAPTGVAAINAGGVTMHSFFQLPFGPYIPATQRGFSDNPSNISDKHSLLKNIRFNNEKRELLQQLELLIIDEVSMVRCDMLDAIDVVLKYYRKNQLQPFGGVQVVYIGDLFQLPPVMPEDQWDLLRNYYESPFFFHAKVIKEQSPLYIELKKVYRQSDQRFIDVLNRVRNNKIESSDLQLLNNLYQPQFKPPPNEYYIVLSTHNRKADAINRMELTKLEGKMYEFNGTIEGEFSDKALPTEMVLQLKVGAQIMFIKNDTEKIKRYYNGKIGTIRNIKDNDIEVSFLNESGTLLLKKETWKNIRYQYNKEKDVIDEEELGSFSQYPIRLAWAITIHKSQGLTFDKAIIDAGFSFAPGQVYVALSRCTSLSGLVLHSRIEAHCIKTDQWVISFAEEEASQKELERLLLKEQSYFIELRLMEIFNWLQLVDVMHVNIQSCKKKKHPDKKLSLELAEQLYKHAIIQQEVALKFQKQLNNLLAEVRLSGSIKNLKDRFVAATHYFINSIEADFEKPVQQHISFLQQKPKVRKFLKELNSLEVIIKNKKSQLKTAVGLLANITV